MSEVGSVSGASQAAYVQPAKPSSAPAPEANKAEAQTDSASAESTDSAGIDTSTGHVDVQA
jgi:hypothetical protein